jgi:small-conductance mechanosensitive channel
MTPVVRSGFPRAATAVALAAVVLAGLQGWLWSVIAPGVQYQVFGNQSWAPLPTETQHIFVAFALFALTGLFAGVLLALLGWAFAGQRGAGMILVVGASALLGSLLAGRLGRLLASGTEPASIAATAGAQQIVTAPAVLTGWPGYLAAPTAAVIVYTFLASWNGLPNLGRERT